MDYYEIFVNSFFYICYIMNQLETFKIVQKFMASGLVQPIPNLYTCISFTVDSYIYNADKMQHSANNTKFICLYFFYV